VLQNDFRHNQIFFYKNKQNKVAMSSFGGGSSNHFGSPHSDVLSVIVNETSTVDQKETLYTELQRRSKAAVQAQQWYDAVTLYTKAIECCTIDSNTTNDATTTTTTEPQYQHRLPITKATLHANISLCMGKMSRLAEAVTNAQQSVDIDPTYMKGWYRLGQAQVMVKDYSNAITAFEKAITLDASNNVLKKELEKCKAAFDAQVKEDALMEEQNQAQAQASESSTTTFAVSTKNASSVLKPNAPKVAKDDDIAMTVTDTNDDATNNEFTKSDHIRGYKIVNGKKTSYFHNELSEDAKKLIGDIAPKKLEATTANETADASNTEQQGTSVWNKAGTWEEKDCTLWATDTITDMLTKVTYTLPASSPAPDAVASISKVVVQPSSHASFATVRGKKRYIYELDMTIHWNFIHNELSASGTMRFPDIDGTCTLCDGYDATEYTVVQIDDSTMQPVLSQFCYQQGLRLRIHDAIDDWVRLFKDTY
jgi:tetratricopeptide (TPR) repeat protein